MSYSTANALYRLASASGVLLGVFFLMGAYGHFEAVRGALDGSADTTPGKRMALLLPGMLLMVIGATDILLSRALWSGRAWTLHVLLAMNSAGAAYFFYLMTRDLPGHPVGEFLALVACYLVLLGAIRLGLVWPAPEGAEHGEG